MPDFLTPEETAEQLKVEVEDVVALIEQGKLRAIRIGKSIRIPEPELENLTVTSPAGPAPAGSREPEGEHSWPAGSRLLHTRSGRAVFRVSGSIASGAEIWPGKMRYPIRFPKAFMESLLAEFPEGEVAVGGSFDGPTRGSLGEFIQKNLKTKMNPAVYLAALLIEEGYADAAGRGYIAFRSAKKRGRK